MLKNVKMSNYTDTEELKNEMLSSQIKGEASYRLKEIYVEIAQRIANRYEFADDDHRLFTITSAYDACIKHGLRFKPEKLTNAYAYVSTIIRCSFASSTVKIKRERGEIPPLPKGAVVLECGEWAESSSEGIKVHKL